MGICVLGYLETSTQIGRLSPLTDFGEAPVKEKMEVHARIVGAEVLKIFYKRKEPPQCKTR